MEGQKIKYNTSAIHRSKYIRRKLIINIMIKQLKELNSLHIILIKWFYSTEMRRLIQIIMLSDN